MRVKDKMTAVSCPMLTSYSRPMKERRLKWYERFLSLVAQALASLPKRLGCSKKLTPAHDTAPYPVVGR